MSDHYTREVEPHQDDLFRCFGCGVMSDRVPVFVQPHDPDPATWEANPPCLCGRCQTDAQKIQRAVSILRHHQMASDSAVAQKSSCGIAAVCRLILNILEDSA